MKNANKIVILFFALFIISPGFAQNKQNLPNKNIDVKRQYDKDGNLIRYDSTYVYSWSSDSTHQFVPDSSFFGNMDIDQMHKMMREQMNRFFGSDSTSHSPFGHPFFDDDFFGDGFFDSDFFKRNFDTQDSTRTDFFNHLDEIMKKHQSLRFEHMDRMQQELDSLRQQFMQQRQKYLEQRDSIYRKHRKDKGETVDI